ncbi:MAG: TIGR04086 family membrane protein [Firmicutes bacterium]|jgi:putative membrane protein (TIGR04086 family)|nr:TIGR04086 family membrane protein [Bacillota bacterium]
MEKIMRICKGYIISLVTFGILTLVGALLMKVTPFPEEGGFQFIVGAMTICCMFVSMYMSSYFQKAGLLIGLVSSVLMLVLILLIVSACFFSFLNLSMLRLAYLVPIGGGLIGGIWGANLKK